MSKYLPELGWKPIIYTPSNPDSSVNDESLLAEIHPEVEEIKTPIWEPYDVYRKLTGQRKLRNLKPDIFQKHHPETGKVNYLYSSVAIF